jgi:hypothetical protein
VVFRPKAAIESPRKPHESAETEVVLVAGPGAARPFTGAKGSGAYDAMIALAERCMADYDDNGWTGDTWFDPSDIGNMSGRSA